MRTIGALLFFATIQLSSTNALSAQAYGLDSRPSAQPYLNMPVDLPTPTGNYITELAFPNLTFQNPVCLTHLPGTNLLFVCEREGRIYSFHNDPGTSTKTLVLDVSDVTQGWDDCGLLGIAFHPEFGVQGSPNRGYFYVRYHYTDNPVPGPGRPPSATPAFNRLSRFTIPDGSFVADRASELVLIQQHDRHVWHNGGALFFHPVDGFLYLSIGDEGAANDSYNSVQKIDDKLFGGIFRIDVDMRGGSISHPIRRQPQSYAGRPSFTQNYYIPNDNPWLDANGTLLEEFWAHGVRSPHRMTYDQIADMLLLGDVGQATWEEVSIIEKGGNYQWPFKEGFANGSKSPPANLIGVEKSPIYDYRHGSGFPFEGNCVIGGYIYRGTEHPDLYGKYIFGDNTRGRIWSMDLSVNPVQVTYLCNMPSGSNYNGLSSFGVDANDELYMCKMGHTGAGRIYKLGRSSTSGVPIPPLLSQTGAFSDVANLVPSPGLIPYDVGSPLWSDAAIKTRFLSVPDGQVILFNERGEWVFPAGTVFVKHFALVVDEVTQSQKRLETRLFVQKADGSVYGVTYKWRNDNSDADLLMNGLDEDITINTATGSRVQAWSYPSSQACLTCHTDVANHILGVKTRQLNNEIVYPGTGVQDNQLRALNHVGMFDVVLNEASIPTYDSLASLTDTGPTLEHKVRSYLDANCGHCHRPGHVQAFFDANFDTPLASQGLIDGIVGNDLGISGAAVIRPRDLNRSILRVRDNSLDPTIKMPPLGKNMIDNAWIALLDQYIDSLPGMPVLDPPTITPASGSYDEMVDVSIAHPEPTAEIYYTTDGSDPNTSSVLYTGSFTLTSSATVKAKVFAPGFVDSIVTQSTYTVTSFRSPDNPPAMSPGIDYEQFLGTFNLLPSFNSLTPDDAGTRSNFDISPRLQNDNFAFRFIGYINIPTTDVYTFYTNSDDGSQLFIGTGLVVDNDGLHSPATQSGQIALQAGLHSITVTFFEKGGGEVLDVHYESSTIPKTLIPASALYNADSVATVSLTDLTVVYDGSPVAMTGTTIPSGLPLIITYDGSPFPPSDAGVYAVVAMVNDPVFQGTAIATLTIEKALASILISGTNHIYDGSAKSATVTTTPLSLVVSTTYNGSAQLPIDVGSYSVDVNVIDQNYTGSSSATLNVNPASANVILGNLFQVYDGTQREVGVTTLPGGLVVDVTYDGSSTPPIAAGSYAVQATVNELNYTGSTAATLTVAKAAATITITNLTHVYDASTKPATIATVPPALAFSTTYNGSSQLPVDVGAYTVDVAVSDPNYTGSNSATLNINPASATVILGNLSQTYDGTQRVVGVTTMPGGLAVDVTYDGSSTPPIAAGSYAVQATVNELNYTGSTAATLSVAKAAATIMLGDLAQTFSGAPRVVTTTTTPPGLSVSVRYDSSPTPPAAVGIYIIDAAIDEVNYTGTASGILAVEGLPKSLAIETGIVANVSSASWTKVKLSHTFGRMVVVCTPIQTTTIPFAVRVQNAIGSSFDVKLARVDGNAGPLIGISVHFVAVEEGVYTDAIHGVTMEAVKIVSTATDNSNSWQAESNGYANSYTNPVVIGQVMTAHDASFSVFWAHGGVVTDPPSASILYVGKHVGEDLNANRVDETIGYIVLDQGIGAIAATPYLAALGADSVGGTGNSPPYSYGFSSLGSSPESVALSTAGMDGGNGGWPVLFGANALHARRVDLAVEEDRLADLERSHTKEQVAHVIFGQPFTMPPTIDLLSATPSAIYKGGQSLLQWQTTAATRVSIDNGLGNLPNDGSVMVSPLATTTYKLTATGPAGSATANVTIIVGAKRDIGTVPNRSQARSSTGK